MTDKDFTKAQVWNHPPGTRYQVLLTPDRAHFVMDEWLAQATTADIRVRRARTPHRIVIETTDVVFASHIVMFNPGCQVHIATPIHTHPIHQ